MNQANVREIYLRVIDATIEGVRTELAEKNPDEATLESLNLLKTRWATRLTHTHEFTDDPALIDKPSSSSAGKGGKKATNKNAKKKGIASPKSPARPASRNGGISVAALTNQTDDSSIPGSSSQLGKSEPALRRSRDIKTEDEPPSKRPRHDLDEEPDHGGEDLDSSDDDDSDVNGNGSEDEAAENLVLAQHDRVKKGPKWKVILREGIVSIRGREYLFNRATCDLDF